MIQSELQKILLVEDEEHIQTVARMSLELTSSYEVKTCNNGMELVESYDEFQPDIILLDVMMPILDGPGAIEKLRDSHPEGICPVIFMTAKAQSKEIDHLLGLGAIGVISKPFDPMTLSGEISELWDQAR